jgi:glycosyltransferase involved in cell wall biosynthesis
MRVLCLAADASSNSLVRFYPIARVLARTHEVSVAGFQSRETLFGPYANEFEYRTLRTGSLLKFFGQMRRLVGSLDADLVYAFKPLSTSLWTGLAARRQLDVPLIVDIEDWELGWYLDQTVRAQSGHLLRVNSPNALVWTAINEALVRRADHRFVVSRFLQRRFGGTLLAHGPDTEMFAPARWPRDQALDELGMPDADYVVFAGTPMRHKGLDDLLASLERLGRPDTRLLLVGSFEHDPAYCEYLVSRFRDLVTVVGPRPHAEMPLFLAVASVVVLPQQQNRETTAQVPGKVFEAMSMAKPILATAVSDLPTILGGCGITVPPGDAAALDAGLTALLDRYDLRRELGDAARTRCEREFGWDAMEKILDRDIGRLC